MEQVVEDQVEDVVELILRPTLFDMPLLRLVKMMVGAALCTFVVNPPLAVVGTTGLIGSATDPTQILAEVAPQSNDMGVRADNARAVIGPNAPTRQLFRAVRKVVTGEAAMVDEALQVSQQKDPVEEMWAEQVVAEKSGAFHSLQTAVGVLVITSLAAFSCGVLVFWWRSSGHAADRVPEYVDQADDDEDADEEVVRMCMRPTLFNTPILRLVRIVVGASLCTIVVNPPQALFGTNTAVPLPYGEEWKQILTETMDYDSATIVPNDTAHSLVRAVRKKASEEASITDAEGRLVMQQMDLVVGGEAEESVAESGKLHLASYIKGCCLVLLVSCACFALLWLWRSSGPVAGLAPRLDMADVAADDEQENEDVARIALRPALFNMPVLRFLKFVLGAAVFTLVVNPPDFLSGKATGAEVATGPQLALDELTEGVAVLSASHATVHPLLRSVRKKDSVEVAILDAATQVNQQSDSLVEAGVEHVFLQEMQLHASPQALCNTSHKSGESANVSQAPVRKLERMPSVCSYALD